MVYLKLLRPKQWIKNLLVFVPIFFAQDFFGKDKIWQASLSFIVFCFTASTVYIMNDIFDRKIDQNHPKKQHRPIASGKVTVKVAVMMVIASFLLSVILSYVFIPLITPILLVYLFLNLVYSWRIKHVVIFDVLFISIFYLLRILAGGLATNTPISSWLILCVFFASLLVIIGKRIGEQSQLHKREVLQYYSSDFLKQLLSISSSLVVVSYGLYSILGFHLGDHPNLVVYSIFFVVLGVFRYLYLIYSSAEVEFPEKLIFSDKVVFGSFVGWILYMFFVIYL
jgi:4-hydroxybenzoate polyprenyltransferase